MSCWGSIVGLVTSIIIIIAQRVVMVNWVVEGELLCGTFSRIVVLRLANIAGGVGEEVRLRGRGDFEGACSCDCRLALILTNSEWCNEILLVQVLSGIFISESHMRCSARVRLLKQIPQSDQFVLIQLDLLSELLKLCIFDVLSEFC